MLLMKAYTLSLSVSFYFSHSCEKGFQTPSGKLLSCPGYLTNDVQTLHLAENNHKNTGKQNPVAISYIIK